MRSLDLEQLSGLRARIVQGREQAIADPPGAGVEMRTQGIYVGVDVSNAHLDVARHDDDEVWRVSNDEEVLTSW
jgi:hypothetical protein